VVLAGAGDTNEPCLVFNKVGEGKTVKNRLHLDLAATDWEAEIGRLTSLGATRVREVQENGARWITLADPEGNEFDLVRA
jgi:predicted enzyme related to lactoylglutathione lyase